MPTSGAVMAEAFPLQWPVGRERTSDRDRRYGNLAKMPSGRIRQLLSNELKKMGADNFVISSNLAIRNDGLPYANQRDPEDTGVVLYFTRKGRDIAISCDKWMTIDANLRAVGLTIEAIRGMERWGTEEMVDRAFTGFAALPESIITPPPSRPHREWYQVLGVDSSANAHDVRSAYREMLKLYHPDAGGDPAEFAEIQKAYQEWQAF